MDAVDRSTDREESGVARHGAALAAVCCLVAAALTFWRTHAIGLLGFDTYPILLTSEVHSVGDLFALFGRPLMDGRYPGEFYRPLLDVSFAVERAVWGLDPTGYQLTGALLFGGCGWAVWALARTVGGASARGAPWVALAAFLLHPLCVEVVPVPARRPELLCCGLMALSLAAQGWRIRRDRGQIVGALAFLAMAAKETAFLLPAAGWLVAWVRCVDGSPGSRAVRALRESVPYAIAAALMLGIRFAVLGGLGGHETTDLAGLPVRAPESLFHLVALLVAPQPAMRPVAFVLAGLAALVLGTTAFRTRADARGASAALRLVTVGIGWLVFTSQTYAVAGSMQAWYVLLPAAGWALVAAGALECGAGALRDARDAVRAAATAGVALALTVLGWQARFHPWVHDYQQWTRATEAADEFLAGLHEGLEASGPGQVLVAPPLPFWVRAGTPSLLGGAILTDYSVQAWCEIAFPERATSVLLFPEQATAADSETVVVLDRLRPGFQGPYARGERSPAE